MSIALSTSLNRVCRQLDTPSDRLHSCRFLSVRVFLLGEILQVRTDKMAEVRSLVSRILNVRRLSKFLSLRIYSIRRRCGGTTFRLDQLAQQVIGVP